MIRYAIAALLVPLALTVPSALAASGGQGTALPRRSSGAVVARAGSENGPITFASLGQSTQTLSGSNPSLDLWVPAPAGVLGPNTTLRVVYAASSLLDSRRSSLGVVVNGVSVAGHLLDGRPDQPTALTFQLPAASLARSGVNHLQLTFMLQGGSSNACSPYDPNLNVTIYGTSRLQFDAHVTRPGVFHPDLANLPAPFATAGTPPLTVDLPVSATDTELTAAGRVLARLGEDTASSPPAVITATAATLAPAAARSQVLLIGTPADNPALAGLHLIRTLPVSLSAGAWRDARGRELPAAEGLVLELANPWNDHLAALAVTGNGQEGVRRAAAVLASATLRRLLHGSYALLPAAPHVPPPPAPVQGTVTLADLGYQSTTVEGVGEQDARFTFDLTRVPQSGAALHLIYGHSDAADPALSSVRVDLNGQPLASNHFSTNDPPRQHWSIALPGNLLTVGTNVLTVRFFLDTAYAYCKSAAGPSLWGTVDAASTLSLPPAGETSTPTLDLLPYPLVIDGSPAGTVLVVPPQPARQVDALDLAVLLGTQSHADAPDLTVVGAGDASPALLRGHTVVLDGLPRSNPLVRQVEPYVPVHATSSLDLSADTSGLDATVREAGQVGIVEEFASPWDAGHAAVLLSATENSLLPPMRRAIVHSNLGNLTGNVATVDKHGRVRSFDTALVGPITPPSPRRPIAALTLAGIMALVLVAALTITQRYQVEKDKS